MKKKTLYMIGNSHIDPVWFWSWEEGMQEVKATYASVLDRMKEFPDFRFTSTSTAFFEWIEEILPDMFEEIRQRVEEGRWELTGGWFIEPDCLLPGGEAFVRQGLYGQRWLKKRFGRICRIGSNVDSFGHNSSLPQILKKSGMDAYVFMRPRLDTPVFRWEGLDGSSICAISLPGEYTTWFYEPTKENIEKTLEASSDFDKMVCCYGVGNHGGGPTKDNIHSIHRLSREIEHVELIFSSYTDFLKELDKTDLPLRRGPFERINVGCYSIDSRFKQANRLAEKRLAEAEFYLTFAKERLGRWMPEAGAMERLWKAVLFNQFHDTLGGTVIYEAREKALAQLEGACAEVEHIKALAIQRIVNTIDTRENSAAWGYPRLEGEAEGAFICESMEVLEQNFLRVILRCYLRYEASELVLDYILEKDCDQLKVNGWIHNHQRHAQIALSVKSVCPAPVCRNETCFLVEEKAVNDGSEYYQHRFADIAGPAGDGITVFNNSSYGMRLMGNEYLCILSRSAMFARGGNGPEERSMKNRFMDQGVWEFQLGMLIHDKPVKNSRLFQIADQMHMPVEYLGDSNHKGKHFLRKDSSLTLEGEGVCSSAMKQKEGCADSRILRFFETEGAKTRALIHFRNSAGAPAAVTLKPYEVKTIEWTDGKATLVDMVEKPLELTESAGQILKSAPGEEAQEVKA